MTEQEAAEEILRGPFNEGENHVRLEFLIACKILNEGEIRENAIAEAGHRMGADLRENEERSLVGDIQAMRDAIEGSR